MFETPTVLAGIQVGSGRSGNGLRWLEPGQQLSSRQFFIGNQSQTKLIGLVEDRFDFVFMVIADAAESV